MCIGSSEASCPSTFCLDISLIRCSARSHPSSGYRSWPIFRKTLTTSRRPIARGGLEEDHVVPLRLLGGILTIGIKVGLIGVLVTVFQAQKTNVSQRRDYWPTSGRLPMLAFTDTATEDYKGLTGFEYYFWQGMIEDGVWYKKTLQPLEVLFCPVRANLRHTH